MTRREKVLSMTALALVALVGGGLLVHLFIWQPITDLRGRITQAQLKLNEKQADLLKEQKRIEGVLKVNPRLSLWNKLSLSPDDPKAKKIVAMGKEAQKLKEAQHAKHVTALQREYATFLRDLMRNAGLRDANVNPRTPERSGTPSSTAKKTVPAFERLAFEATRRGDMAAVSKALESFHTTRLLHHIRRLDLGLAKKRLNLPEGTLEVKMTVEALLVNGAEMSPKLEPNKPLPYTPRVLAEAKRDYRHLAARNVFTGIKPPVQVAAKDDKKPLTEEKKEVLRFVRLTMLYYDNERERWAATLYDQAKEDGLINLNTGILGRNFVIKDKYDEKTLEGRVVKITDEELIFKSDDQFYRVLLGEFLYPAIRTPLKDSELRKLGLKEDE